jgi:8-amino-7-oxononanoate synthase
MLRTFLSGAYSLNFFQMNLLREKMMKYDAPQRAKAAVSTPISAIESDQDTEVVINEKKC